MVNGPYGYYWKFIKKVIATKMLRPQVLERSQGVCAEELEKLYKRVLDKATMKKERVEIFEEMMRFVNNNLCKMTMGRSFSEEDSEAERILELASEVSAMTRKIFLAQILRKSLGISLFKKEIMDVSGRFEDLLEKILVEHEKKLDEHHQGEEDAMDVLLAAYRDPNAEYKITRNQIKSLFAELFLGGNDSSSTATQWAMAEITNNPKILERLREDIDYVVGKTRLIQETDLPKLPYLQAVVKEVLRLHPSVPFLIRKFQEGCKIGEFYIPEGTELFINVYALMRDPNVWQDPNEFKPERFLASLRYGEEDEIRERALKFMTFGSGRRRCTGENLAYLFIGTVIGMMVQCFDWEIEEDNVNMEEVTGKLFLTMAHPLKYTLLPRTIYPLPSYPHGSSS